MQEIAFPGFKFQIFLTFCAFFPLFISNTSIVSINFGANLDAQNAGNDISGIKFQNFKFHAWYIGHTRGLQPLLSPDSIYCNSVGNIVTWSFL